MKTRILHSSVGWYDIDQPTVFFNTRREAREDRRRRNPPKKNRVSASSRIKAVVTALSGKPAIPHPALTTLQQKLDARLAAQGVSHDERFSIIMNFGYNASASYGHMRAAGATHDEAKSVIELDNPAFSVTYGKMRADGFGHVPAWMNAQTGMTYTKGL